MIRLLLPLLLFPVPSWAEVVSIRSGEHETFSRLVLSIQEGTGWTVNETDVGYQIALEDHRDGFDFSEVLERLPRNRMVGVGQIEQDTLELKLSCDCVLETFLWRPDRLVLDVVESPESREFVEPEVLRSTQAVSFGTSQDIERRLPDLAPFSNELSLTQFSVAVPRSSRSNVMDYQADEDTILSEAMLLEGIFRAATQGFLNPNIQSIPVDGGAERETIEPEIEILSIEQADAFQFEARPGIDISTALDQSLLGLNDALRDAIGGGCLPAEFFEIADWGDERAFHEQVAMHSDALAGEFGLDLVEAETDLARLYIHFGFGSEAEAVLSISQTASQPRQVLFELAGLLDGTRKTFPLLVSQRNCETSGALWAFLAAPMKFETEQLEQAITRAFFELPQPLRSHVALLLSDAFLSVDMTESAERVLRTTESKDAEQDSAVQTTRAVIAERNNEPDEAIAILSDQAADDVRFSPEAAIRLIELTIEQGEVPTEDDLMLLSALAVEFDTHDIVNELAAMQAVGWSARGEFIKAFEIVSAREDAPSKQALNAVFVELTEKGASGDFLELVIKNRPVGLSASTENRLGRRLIDLGFPNFALQVMRGPATREPAAERRYLRAEAELVLENYEQTIAELQGMTDERARSLRAAAYSGLGNYPLALQSLENDQEGATSNLQFRAGAWERLSTEADPVLSAFARTVVSETNPSEIVTLEDRRSLLSQSEESRRAVEGLLLKFDGSSPAN